MLGGVRGRFRQSVGSWWANRLVVVVAPGWVVYGASLALCFARFHPSSPFVVGDKGDGEDQDNGGDEDPFHGQSVVRD